MWLLALIPSRIQVYLAIALAFAAALAGAYFKGRLDQKALCQEASLRVKIEALERDLRSQRIVDAIEDAERLTLQKLHEENEAEIAAYALELQNRPDSNCALTPGDIRGVYGGR